MCASATVTISMAEYPERTHEAAERVCEALKDGRTLSTAAVAGRMTLGELRAWQRADPRFADRVNTALEVGDHMLEDLVRDRAIGREVPIVNKDGDVVGHKEQYSERCLFRLLEARNPARWRSAVPAGISPLPLAAGETAMGIDFSNLTTDEQRQLRDLLAAAEERAARQREIARQSGGVRSDVPKSELH